MSRTVAHVELFRFPLPPGDAIAGLRREAQANLQRTTRLPWMVLGVTTRERLAIVGADPAPDRLAAVERSLETQPGLAWTALVGQAALPSGAGLLPHLFVRLRRPDGAWEAWVRPWSDTPQGVVWLGEWTCSRGQGLPKGHPLFPTPHPDPVPLARPDGPAAPSWEQSLEAPLDARELADRLGAFACRWFAEEGRLPPQVVRMTASSVEGLLVGETALAADLADAAIRWAQQPETLAVGTCRRQGVPKAGPAEQQILLRLELKDGPGLTWSRRYTLSVKQARWAQPEAEVALTPRSRGRSWLR